MVPRELTDMEQPKAMDALAYQNALSMADLAIRSPNAAELTAQDYLRTALRLAVRNGWRRKASRVLYALKMAKRIDGGMVL